MAAKRKIDDHHSVSESDEENWAPAKHGKKEPRKRAALRDFTNVQAVPPKFVKSDKYQDESCGTAGIGAEGGGQAVPVSHDPSDPSQSVSVASGKSEMDESQDGDVFNLAALVSPLANQEPHGIPAGDVEDFDLPALPEDDGGDGKDQDAFERMEAEVGISSSEDEVGNGHDGDDDLGVHLEGHLERHLDEVWDLVPPPVDHFDNEVLAWNDVDHLPEYQDEVYTYQFDREMERRPALGFLDQQQYVTVNLRHILVKYLFEITEGFDYKHETVFLTVALLDRFINSAPQQINAPDDLQTAGVAAVHLAGKYMEDLPVTADDLVFMTDGASTRQGLLQMEKKMLQALDFNLNIPTSDWFASGLLALTSTELPDPADRVKLKHLTMYLCHLVLIEPEILYRYSPSLIGAAAFAYARLILNFNHPSNYESARLSTYSPQELKLCAIDMCFMHNHLSQVEANHSCLAKFSTDKYGKVAQLDFPSFHERPREASVPS